MKTVSRRLQTDYIDIYYTHWQTPDFALYPLEETVGVLTELKKEGKIRAIGASNVTEDIIKGILAAWDSWMLFRKNTAS